MFLNLTNTTNTEFLPEYGIVRRISSDAISLGSGNQEFLDALKMTATKFKLNYIFDYVDVSDIIFEVFPSEQRQMISEIAYNESKILGVVNMEPATAKPRVDGDGVTFSDPSEGYIALLHALLRKGIVSTKPIESLLDKIHNIFTKFLYSMTIRTLDKHFNLLGKPEKDLACIRYACAYVSACKFFDIDVSPNEIAVPLTQIQFTRVDPKEYETNEDLSSFANVCKYLSERNIMPNLDVGTFMDGFVRNLGYRSIVELSCGLDLFLDILLCKSVGRIIPRNLFKVINPKDQLLISQICNTFFTANQKPQSKMDPYLRAPETQQTEVEQGEVEQLD